LKGELKGFTAVINVETKGADNVITVFIRIKELFTDGGVYSSKGNGRKLFTSEGGEFAFDVATPDDVRTADIDALE
jgi:hypothetical protein